MATATGFSFGSTGTNSLFGAKTSAATGSSFSFGTSTAASGFGAAKTTASTGFSFGAPVASTAPAAKTGFSFGGAAAASSATTAGTTTGFSFGAKPASSSAGLFGSTAVTTSASTGLSLFGAKPTLGSTGFGTTTNTSGLSLTSTASAANSTSAKPTVNPKEENVPAELTTLVTNLEKKLLHKTLTSKIRTFIKSQKEIKEEISKFSVQAITKSSEELIELKQIRNCDDLQLKGMWQNINVKVQSVSLIANGLQRDSVAVENLKHEVNQELKNAEIVHRIKDVAVSLQHEFNAPMEYFSRLVYSFEVRINSYRKEIEELEMFLSATSPRNTFTPQDLLTVLRRVNESFIGLASELQQVHEIVKTLKEKYRNFRRIVYNDSTDPFASRKKIQDSRASFVGPSPFPIVQGASIMASKPETKAPTIGLGIGTSFGPCFGSNPLSFSKSSTTSLTRSLSFGGTGKSSGTSFFDKPALGVSPSLNLATPSSTSTFMLQKPPSGKRGKLF